MHVSRLREETSMINRTPCNEEDSVILRSMLRLHCLCSHNIEHQQPEASHFLFSLHHQMLRSLNSSPVRSLWKVCLGGTTWAIKHQTGTSCKLMKKNKRCKKVWRHTRRSWEVRSDLPHKHLNVSWHMKNVCPKSYEIPIKTPEIWHLLRVMTGV